jgi:hypothetical protein
MKPKNITTLRLIKSIGGSSLRLALLLIPLVFACFALSPMAQAVSPPPDGGYSGGNTAEGDNALLSLTDGDFNTAVGWHSLRSNRGGFLNTGVGAGTLLSNIGDNSDPLNPKGVLNTAVGAGALFANTTGTGGTANGALALSNNTTGKGNTAVGATALLFNTNGQGNTAVGAQALQSNGPGEPPEESSLNTAVGVNALTSNTIGFSNTAVGAGPGEVPNPEPTPPATIVIPAALGSNTTGICNTAVGGTLRIHPAALGLNTEGSFNTAVGNSALSSNTTGGNNIALGNSAGSNLTTGGSNIDIGNFGVAGDANTIRIGTQGTQTATFIAGVSGAAVMGSAVKVNAAGQLGTAPSSVRFKENIKPMDKASEAILALKPVTFRYKKEIDPDRTPEFGLVAEDVAKVNPDLVFRDAEGKVYSVRYEAVNAMLLNEFLKEHRKVEELTKEFQTTVAQQQKQIEALTTGLQKASAQLEASKAAPQVVNNP